MRKLALVLAALLTSVILGACSSSGGSSHPSGSSSSSSTAAAGGTITISSFAYSGDLTVQPGEKVTVLNKDSVPHTLTDKTTGKFDTGTIPAGGSGTFTAPTTAGSYPFGCRIHAEMKGTLVVQ